MLSSLLKSLFGTSSERDVKRMMPVLEAVRDTESTYARMTNDELRAQTAVFKERLSRVRAEYREQHSGEDADADEYIQGLHARVGEELDALLPDAFSAVREAAKRVVGMRPFDVQVVGGIVLHRGGIAEMVTGEGKTLVATMPVYLNALTGEGVHVVTVSDYLARRDSEWMGPIYRFMGLTTGLIQHDMDTYERQVGYRADITYGTNNEFGFDYLRDNMAVHSDMRVQRALSYAIVDEVDSILVDEARTPLIISGRPEKSTDLYVKVDGVVRQLRKEKHFELEEKGHHAMLTEEGMETAERLMGVEDLYVDDTLGIVHMIEQSLRAHNFYKRDDEYMVSENGDVLIVDEFTGRAMEGRRFSDGLHQALEAKERVPIQFESQTIASITYQKYFKLYNKIAGMTGTAATEAAEFAQTYDLDVVQIPTNLPLIRDDQTDLIFGTEMGKFKYVVGEIVKLHEEGRPVLVGTVSIEKSELVAGELASRGVDDFQVLNAKHHEREAAIVANAGKRGAITIATNMAGRGTDIKLGEGVRELGGLAIIGTERHESRRIDNQLRGRCGRQGDPGATRFYVSLEDEVARLFGGDKAKKLLDWVGSEEMDEVPLSQRMVSRTIERAQRQVEEYNFEIRKHLLEYDGVMDRQRQIVYGMRRDVLEDRDVSDQIREMFENMVGDAIDEYAPDDVEPDQWDLDGLATRFRFMFGFDPPEPDESDRDPKPVEERLADAVVEEYARREALIADEIRAMYREQIGGDEAAVDFAKLARKQVHDFELMALLRATDDRWIDHLYSMDYLKESVRLRAYGQKDPLVEYKAEGFEMFQQMMGAIEENVVQTLFRLTDPEVTRSRRMQGRRRVQSQQPDPLAELSRYSYVGADKQSDRSFASFDTSRFALAGQNAEAQQAGGGAAPRAKPKLRPIKKGPKTKANEPCPCGSGKKYKKCCGAQN